MIKKFLFYSIYILNLFIFPISVYGKDLYASSEYWGFYLDSCRKLDEAMDVVNKQMKEGSDVVFSNGIKFNLERMEKSIPKNIKKTRDTPHIFVVFPL